MNGPDLLRHAAGVVDKRRSDYGEPEDLFANIAQRWSQVGWSTLSQLPAHERHVAVGGPPLAGTLAMLMDQIGDKMCRHWEPKE